jgi:LuxR family maltose regulon positive regulatory protein
VLAALPDGAEAQVARLQRIRRRLSTRAAGLWPEERLTAREEAVLRLLRGTLSLREIGQELHLSGNTIKTHTRAIYRKLGVTGRREAVEQGRKLGIL